MAAERSIPPVCAVDAESASARIRRKALFMRRRVQPGD
jgi:hypothetical protein